ncbi:transglutaminase domain-containing protein, partial [Paenibacillus sp. MCAF20]
DQKSNTEKIVEEANNDELPAVPEDVPINADTAFETYLAINLLAGNEAISLRAFPEAQNFETITDTLLEVMYQNPLIIGIDAWGYDYKKLTLGVRYNDNPEEIKKQQEEIVNEASKIVADIIKEGMSDEEKREAIYRYLADNTKYDDAALKAAEANDFQGDLDEQFDDSFTTYGIMVKKVGVCMSYAYSYKLLSDLAGLESIVVTGDANGVPHAWNKVKIGDEWLHVDVTNNDSDSSLGFRLLYNSNDDSAVAVNSIVSDEYWVNTEIEQFYGKDNSNDYYV